MKANYRDVAFAAYPPVCDRCGATKQGPGSMHVHHRDFNHGNDEVGNLQILCNHCHRIVHWEAGSFDHVWEKRRTKGGKYNDRGVLADGALRPDLYRDDPETGCRIWLGVMNGRTPSYAHRRGGWRSVRRELWRIHRGEPVPEFVGASCENAECVAVGHLQDRKTWHGKPIEIREYIAAAAPLASIGTIAKRLGISSQCVKDHIRRIGAARTPTYHVVSREFAVTGLPDRPESVSDRHWSIFAATLGTPYPEVGKHFGISRQRVDQIVRRVLAQLEEAAA